MTDYIEKRYFKPGEAAKELKITNAYLCQIMAILGYNRSRKVSKEQLDMCRKYLIFRHWLKIKPYPLGLLRLIRDI